jgi:DNA-binding FrmR family transcriptional regulator
LFYQIPPGSIFGMPNTTSADTRGYSESKDALLKRLRRIEGQVRGIQRMVDEDRWCPDILQQIAAVNAAMDKVALGLAAGHVQHCMARSDDPKRREEMTEELMSALGRLVT